MHREAAAQSRVARLAQERGSTNANVTRRRINLQRAQYAVQREIDRSISLDSLAVLQESLSHFYWRARILETLGGEGDYDLLDRAWAECGRWAEKLAQFEHPKIQAVPLAADPNTPLLPQDMTIEELRDSILADLERLRDSGVLQLPGPASSSEPLHWGVEAQR
jgi:hypothetical protein